MLRHAIRHNKLHVFTLDKILAGDITERLKADPRLAGVQAVVPGGGQSKIKVADLELLAKDTVTSRVIIMDVRRVSLPRVMGVYNRVVGYNRADFNERCHTVLIGDGPLSMLNPGAKFEVFAAHLARFRMDFHAAAYFYDPFLHYGNGELSVGGLDFDDDIAQSVPQRLAADLQGLSNIDAVRRRFRGEDTSPQQAQAMFIELMRRRIAAAFPAEKPHLDEFFRKAGRTVPGETLALNIYPLFFEERIADLLTLMRPAKPKKDRPFSTF